MRHTTSNKNLEELKQIAKSHNGVLKPEAVVEFAKNPKTSLHNYFDWDNTIAATNWRLDQARRLIRFSISVITIKGKKVKVRVFLSTNKKGNNDFKHENAGYKTTLELLRTKQGRESVLNMALSELLSIKEKYRCLSELSGVFDEIDKVNKKLSFKHRNPSDPMLSDTDRKKLMDERLELIKASAENHLED